MKSEFDIHHIIKTHPYLLGSEYKTLLLKHEKIYDDRTRSDFVFSDDYVCIVVEVKIGAIDLSVFEQALHYLNKENRQTDGKSIKGVLIGSIKTADNYFYEKIATCAYPIEIKLLNKDIPTRIKLCDNCRKANYLDTNHCAFCGKKKFIEDPFLF